MRRFYDVTIKKKPIVSVLRLKGSIQDGTGRSSINVHRFEKHLEQVFMGSIRPKQHMAVALVINSPGGSPVQSSLMFQRICQLSKKKNASRKSAGLDPLPVIAFVEDVCASGGYYIACSADEIVADASSVVGSIGVIRAGFGFSDAIERLGIERRVQTSGTSKSQLDPFRPEEPSDRRAIEGVMASIHREFIDVVKASRGARLDAGLAQQKAAKIGAEGCGLFDGSYYDGRAALEVGLIDGIGTLHGVVQERFGPDCILMDFSPKETKWAGLLPKLGGDGSAEALVQTVGTQLQAETLNSCTGLGWGPRA
jgi:serine protease SohB